MKKQLIANRILCLLCDDLIQSKHGHDMQWCNCHSVATDGGLNYLKRTGESFNYVDASIYSNKHSDCRKYLHWGVSYDKNGDILPKTIYKSIKDLEIYHIKAILFTQTHISELYRTTFEKELKYRNGK